MYTRKVEFRNSVQERRLLGPAWRKVLGSPRAPEVAMATEPVALEPVVQLLADHYFTCWYKAVVKRKFCDDHCVLQYSNRICVITLAGSHATLQSGKTIKSISHQISTYCSRFQNKVSGKFKWGAQFLTELVPLFLHGKDCFIGGN